MINVVIIIITNIILMPTLIMDINIRIMMLSDAASEMEMISEYW